MKPRPANFKEYRCRICGTETWSSWVCDTCKKKKKRLKIKTAV